jgi:plasmid stabilization system protein ParE
MAEILLLHGAQSDYFEAYCRFGESFHSEIERAFSQIATFPESAPLFFGKYRRIVIRRTPYGAFYTITGNRALIGAILDLRQDPTNILHRLRQLE